MVEITRRALVITSYRNVMYRMVWRVGRAQTCLEQTAKTNARKANIKNATCKALPFTSIYYL